MCIEGNALLSGSSLGNSHGHSENGVGTQLLLVLGAIELVQERVYCGLVLHIDLLLDEGRGDGVVDVADRLGDTLATPLGLVSIAEFASLVGAGGCSRGNNGAVEACLGDNVDLNGRVALGAVSIQASTSADVDLHESHRRSGRGSW